MVIGRRTLAERVCAGDRAAIEHVARALVRVRPDNFVERPWGGRRLAAYKRVSLDAVRSSARVGEAFEIAADVTDPECAAHPSVAVLEDGSEIALPALLDAGPDLLLGALHASRGGARLPILPKTLDVAQQLSVQVHPPGLPELYVVLDADPGATIRLGFARDVDVRELERTLLHGQALVRARGTGDNGPWPSPELIEINATVLGMLNELPVRAGDVIWNASAATRASAVPSADVHALGNQDGRELLVLEVRKPGPTWRLWDHARLPARRLDVAAALQAVSPRASAPGEFVLTPAPLPRHAGVERAVACGAFLVDLLADTAGGAVIPPGAGAPRTLHVTAGEFRCVGAGGEELGVLRRGESALVPAGVAIGEARAGGSASRAVQVTVGGG